MASNRYTREKTRSAMCSASQRVKPQLRALEWAEKGSYQTRWEDWKQNGKSWTVGVVTRKLWEKNIWGVWKILLGKSHFHYASFKTKVLARDGDTHSRELILSYLPCQKYTGPLARTMPQNTYISVDISRKKRHQLTRSKQTKKMNS